MNRTNKRFYYFAKIAMLCVAIFTSCDNHLRFYPALSNTIINNKLIYDQAYYVFGDTLETFIVTDDNYKRISIFKRTFNGAHWELTTPDDSLEYCSSLKSQHHIYLVGQSDNGIIAKRFSVKTDDSKEVIIQDSTLTAWGCPIWMGQDNSLYVSTQIKNSRVGRIIRIDNEFGGFVIDRNLSFPVDLYYGLGKDTVFIFRDYPQKDAIISYPRREIILPELKNLIPIRIDNQHIIFRSDINRAKPFILDYDLISGRKDTLSVFDGVDRFNVVFQNNTYCVGVKQFRNGRELMIISSDSCRSWKSIGPEDLVAPNSMDIVNDNLYIYDGEGWFRSLALK